MAKKMLRSQQWFGHEDKHGFIYRAWLRNRGFPQDTFEGRPIIGICNTWSELTPCNSHFRAIAEHVRWGVLEAGGIPLEFPVTSIGETLVRPTAMLLRNLAAMDVEESLRANPLDGTVLLMGCDKTTPALLMGAASIDLPTLGVSGGPQLRGAYRGGYIGSGTNVFSMSEDLRAGKITRDEYHEAEQCMNRSQGHCMTMGTASTMASVVEALGIGMPGNAAIPAVDARRYLLAREAGRRIVAMVREDLRMSQILTRAAFENAIRVVSAIGGSTNAVIHLLAIAGRIGVKLTLEDFDSLGSGVHCLLNLMPAGKFLMEDFFEAGGLPVIVRELGEAGLFDRQALCVNGRTVWENSEKAQNWNKEVIRPMDNPVKAAAGTAVLRGNLAPNGAIIKPSAATPALMKHQGRAIVFDTIEDFEARIDDPELDVDPTSVLVLRNCGPRGYPGMAEVANMSLPKKILEQGITDMVRLSDARMSGTAYGTVVLHIAPEAAVGGPLAAVRDGDLITLDLEARLLQLEVPDEEITRRLAEWAPSTDRPTRGYAKLYVDTVLGADTGADLDFLVGASGTRVMRHTH